MLVLRDTNSQNGWKAILMESNQCLLALRLKRYNATQFFVECSHACLTHSTPPSTPAAPPNEASPSSVISGENSKHLLLKYNNPRHESLA